MVEMWRCVWVLKICEHIQPYIVCIELLLSNMCSDACAKDEADDRYWRTSLSLSVCSMLMLMFMFKCLLWRLIYPMSSHRIHTQNFYDTLSSHYLLDFRRLNITKIKHDTQTHTFRHTQKKNAGKINEDEHEIFIPIFSTNFAPKCYGHIFWALLTTVKLSHSTQNPQYEEKGRKKWKRPLFRQGKGVKAHNIANIYFCHFCISLTVFFSSRIFFFFCKMNWLLWWFTSTKRLRYWSIDIFMVPFYLL